MKCAKLSLFCSVDEIRGDDRSTRADGVQTAMEINLIPCRPLVLSFLTIVAPPAKAKASYIDHRIIPESQFRNGGLSTYNGCVE
jgi:hypothetical protein